MYVCKYVCVVCIMYVYVSTYVYVCMYVCKYVCMYVYFNEWMSDRVLVMYVLYVFNIIVCIHPMSVTCTMYVCMYVCTCLKRSFVDRTHHIRSVSEHGLLQLDVLLAAADQAAGDGGVLR